MKRRPTPTEHHVYLIERGFTHSNQTDYTRKSNGRTFTITSHLKGWRARTLTSTAAHIEGKRWWKGDLFGTAVTAFVDAELHNWGQQ